jgi:hypothetical protein
MEFMTEGICRPQPRQVFFSAWGSLLAYEPHDFLAVLRREKVENATASGRDQSGANYGWVSEQARKIIGPKAGKKLNRQPWLYCRNLDQQVFFALTTDTAGILHAHVCCCLSLFSG